MEYVEVNGKKKIHHGFWIFIGCCFISAGFFALSSSIVSVFIGQAAAGVNAGTGDWSFNTMLGKITGIAMAPILGRWLQGGPKMFKFACIYSLCCIAGKFYGFSLATELWQVYVLGFIAGSGSGVLMTMINPNLIGNWFASKYRGKYLGICTAFTGVGSFVWAPTFAVIVNEVGYRMGYVICASLMICMCLPWILFVFKYRPEEMGLKQYGYDPNEVEEVKDSASESGMTHTKALKQPAFYLIAITMAVLSLGMGFNSYQTPIAKEILVPTGMDVKAAALVGATMVSTASVGNMLSKIIFGWMQDKIGSRATVLVFGIIFVGAFLCYIFGAQISIAFLYIGAFMLGTHNSLASVGFPNMVRELFGNFDYGKIYAYIAVFTSIGGALGNSLAGWVQQWTGSYINSCWYGIFVALFVTVFGQVCISLVKKTRAQWDHLPEAEENAAKAA